MSAQGHDGRRSVALGVAAVQIAAEVADVPANIRRTEAAAARAADAGALLVVFPELGLTGYDLDALRDDSLWFTADDVRLDGLRGIATRSGATLVVGAPVRSDHGNHLASLVLRPTGEVVIAPKSHLHGDEPTLFVPGSGPVVTDVDGWRVGLAVCVDTSHPEHALQAAGFGVDVYAASVLSTEGEERRLDLRMRARALDHRMYTMAANVAGYPLGVRSSGGSGVWAPDGSAMATAAGRDDEVVHAVLSACSPEHVGNEEIA